MAEHLLSNREACAYLDDKIGRTHPYTLLAELRRKDRIYRPDLPRPAVFHIGSRSYYQRADLDELVANIQRAKYPIIDNPAPKPGPAGKAELHLPDGTIISLTAETARKIADAVIKKATGAVH